MYAIRTTNQFEKDLKRCKKRGLNLSHLQEVIELLSQNGSLPLKYKSHKLSGNLANCWECYIKPDWLLIWKQDDTELLLLLLNTGTHSDLF